MPYFATQFGRADPSLLAWIREQYHQLRRQLFKYVFKLDTS